MYHIVYKTTNNLNGYIYIGIHSTNNIDDGYIGSGVRFSKEVSKIGKEHFTREILHYYDTREEALNKEREIVNKDFVLREDTYNSAIGGKGGTVGMIQVKHKDDQFEMYDKVKVFTIYNDDPRYLSGELVPSCKGFITVKDKEDNTFQVSVNDPRYLSSELFPLWKGKKHKEETKIKIGLKTSKSQKGTGNSQFGTMWITNEIENKKIKKYQEIPKGWRKGARYSKQKYCSNCNCEISNKNKTGLCKECKIKDRISKYPPYEELLNLVSKMNYIDVGKVYGVSHTKVCKWLKYYKNNE
jgi:hypothetical protein